MLWLSCSFVLNILPQGTIPVRGGNRISWSLYLCPWRHTLLGGPQEKASSSGLLHSQGLRYGTEGSGTLTVSDAEAQSSTRDSAGAPQNLDGPLTLSSQTYPSQKPWIYFILGLCFGPPTHLGIPSSGRGGSGPRKYNQGTQAQNVMCG